MTTKQWNQDDPRWTAYVLGELGDDDRAELEAVLADSEEARRFVEALRETTAWLGQELAGESPPALDELQRKRIEKAAAAPPPRRWRRAVAIGTAVAAVAGFALWIVSSQGDEVGYYKHVEEREAAAVASLPEPLEISLLTPSAGDDGSRTGGRRAGSTTSAAHRSPNVNTWDRLGAGNRNRNDPTGRIDNNRDPGTELNGLRADGEDGRFDTEGYDHIVENDFVRVADDALSTFSIDVDTASYANVRRFLERGALPPKDAVRIEELINYFSYDYPTDGEPFATNAEVGVAPWNREHFLLRVGLKGKEVVGDRRPRANLVFLIDVSGSMEAANKLPLLASGMRMLVDRLDSEDQVAIVVYAGASGLVLPSTPASKRGAIKRALGELTAGGSTNGGAGIELAYRVASEHFIEGGVNRVILATDGDFNVGTTSQGELVRLIEDKAKSGVFLTVLGFGMGNYQDATLEQLADRGNGNYAYIDTINEARKVLVEEIHSTLVTIAKDVKIQIEFNPARVGYYRLIGYENRVLAHRDFNDDEKDAGEIGAGHTVTALYELVPAGRHPAKASGVDALKYQRGKQLTAAAASDELLTIKLRYKLPDAERSQLREFPVRDRVASLAAASDDFKFAAAVAAFGMLLRESQHSGAATWQTVLDLAEQGIGDDRFGYRAEFVRLARTAAKLQGR